VRVTSEPRLKIAARLKGQQCKVVRPEILRYAELLLEWNRTVNLTGARTLEQVEALIADADALVGASWTGITRVIDIGSGGGLPAVPLAIAMPQVHFTLLEANARKCAFLEHVAGTLALTNVAVAAGRAEEFGHRPALREQFDRAISRAAARPEVLLELALPFVRTGGDLVAQVRPLDPALLEPAARLLGGGTPRLDHPGGGSALLVVPKRAPTPSRFPRRAGLPGRKPLA
jgi:16S rRNA (guanine527-N7)-methyltransferase